MSNSRKIALVWVVLLLLSAMAAFGAEISVPPGTISSVVAGNTYKLGTGTYTCRDLELASNVSIIGNGQSVLVYGGSPGGGYVARAKGKQNIAISGVVVIGAGFKFEDCRNTRFVDSTIRDVKGDAYRGNCLFLAEGQSGSRFQRLKLGPAAHREIYHIGQMGSDVLFEDLLVEDSGAQPISGTYFGQNSDIVWQYLTLKGSHRHGIEQQNQGTVVRHVLRSIYVGDFDNTASDSWRSNMGISNAMGGDARDCIVEHCVVIADGTIPGKMTGGVPKYYFTHTEIMSRGAIVRNNYGEGWGWWQLTGNNDGRGESTGNVWLGASYAPVIAGRGSEVGREFVPEHGDNGWPSTSSNNYLGRIGDRARPPAGARLDGDQPAPPAVAIVAPAEDTTFAPGQSVTATGVGEDLRWSADRIGDGQPDFASGAGASFTFVVPQDSTTSQKITLKLSGSGGSASREYEIDEAETPEPPVTQPTTVPVYPDDVEMKIPGLPPQRYKKAA